MSINLNIFNVHKQFSLSLISDPLNHVKVEKEIIDLDNSTIPVKERFNEFKTRYNKMYKTALHHNTAYKHFIKADELIQLINSLKLPYTLGHNYHSDYSYNEFIDTFTGLKNLSKKEKDQSKSSSSASSGKDDNPVQIISLNSCYNNTVLDLEDENALTTQKNKMKNASSNSKIDWRYFLPEIKDQGDCGACWAFSSIVSVEGLYNIGEFFKKINDNKYKEGNDTIKWDKLINDIENKDKDLIKFFNDSQDSSQTKDCTNNNNNLKKYQQNISLSEQYIIDCAKFPTVIKEQCLNWGGCDGGSQPDCYNTIKNCGIVPYDKYSITLKDDKKDMQISEQYIGQSPYSSTSVLTDNENYCNEGGSGGDSDSGSDKSSSDIIDPETLDPKDYISCIDCNDESKKILQASKVPNKCNNINCDDDKDGPCRIFINDYQPLGLESKENCKLKSSIDTKSDLEIELIKTINNSPVAVSIYVTPVLRFYKCGIYNQYQDPTSCLQMNIPEIKEENKPGVDINPSQVNHGVTLVGYEVIDNSQDASQSDTTVQYNPAQVDPQTGFKVSDNGDSNPQYLLDGKKNEEIINQLEKIINLNLPHYLSDNDSFKLDDDTDSEFKTNLKTQLDYYTTFKEKIQNNEIENCVYTVRNSWSDSWGENGYFRMQAGINNLQVIEQVYTCSGVSSTPPKDYESTCNFSNADQNENENCVT